MIEDSSKISHHMYSVCVDVTSLRNRLFNEYDDVIYIDDIELGTLANGNRLIRFIELSEGEHVLSVCKIGREKVSRRIVFNVTQDMTLTCETKNKTNSIKCKKADITIGVGDKDTIVENYKNMLLPEAEEMLNSIGIYDIQKEPEKDIYSYNEDSWIVVWQNVDPGKSISKSSHIRLDCIPVSQYFDYYAQGENLSTVYENIRNSGLIIKYCDENSQDITQKIDSMSEEERAEWIVISSNQKIGNEINLKTININERRKQIADEKEKELEKERILAEEEQQKALEEERNKEEEKRKEEEKKKEEERKIEEEKKKEEERKLAEAEKEKNKNSEKIKHEETSKEETVVVPDNPYTYMSDFDVYYQSDYAHLRGESMVLGNNETATFTITARVPDATEEDFYIYCEEPSITYSLVDVHNDELNKKTEIKYKLQATKVGTYEIEIYSCYDLYEAEDDEEVSCRIISIYKLDSKMGKVVYYTPTGEKYHFKETCGGENSTATTLYDAQGAGLEPCGKCAY